MKNNKMQYKLKKFLSKFKTTFRGINIFNNHVELEPVQKKILSMWDSILKDKHSQLHYYVAGNIRQIDTPQIVMTIKDLNSTYHEITLIEYNSKKRICVEFELPDSICRVFKENFDEEVKKRIISNESRKRKFLTESIMETIHDFEEIVKTQKHVEVVEVESIPEIEMFFEKSIKADLSEILDSCYKIGDSLYIVLLKDKTATNITKTYRYVTEFNTKNSSDINLQIYNLEFKSKFEGKGISSKKIM
jgi:hypothetical protein